MPPFSFLRNITNLPTYPINQQSNLLQQDEPPQNHSTIERPTHSTSLTPVNTTLQYPTRTPTPIQLIQRHNITSLPSPTLSHREINFTKPYHVQSDEEDPNNIRNSPDIPTPNSTSHSQPTDDLITQSDLDIGSFQYA
ncbi:hypothetical protein AX16_008992 [Volvariella volvacea WC 439]|nr:hypothetical protein AX16_008992 [Volvariella volvacea WC 439]